MLHPAIDTFLGMRDNKIIVVCVEIQEQLNLKSRRLSVREFKEAYEALITDGADDPIEENDCFDCDDDCVECED